MPVFPSVELFVCTCPGEYAVTSKGDVDTDWNTDYASKGYEYFDVWAPEIATHYGEVFCTPAPAAPRGTRAPL